MKQYSLILTSFFAGICLLNSCTGTNNKTSNEEDSIKVEIIDTIDVPGIINTVGTVGDGTSMHILELISDKGDTILIDCPINMIAGGAEAGDRITVTYINDNNTYRAMTSINLTALEHLWSQTGADGNKQSLEINSGGRAATYDMSIEYDAWSIEEGKLLLHSPKKIASEQSAIVDTFDIMELSDERLVLMHGNLESEFVREN